MADQVREGSGTDAGLILVAYQAADDLSQLLPALIEIRESIPIHIVIIDNASDDNTKEIVRPFASHLTYIRNAENIGFAAAVNQGMTYLKTRFVLLLNPDCRIDLETLSGLVSFLKTHPEAGAAAPRIIYPDGRLQPSRGSYPNLFIVAAHIFRLKRLMPQDERVIRGPLRVLGHIFRQYKPPRDIEEVDYTIGACVLIRRRAFFDAGGMDERFFLYYEEIDLALRMRRCGYRWYFLDNITAIHESEGASRRAPLNPFYQRYRSMALYFRKHKGERQTGIVVFMIALMARVRLLSGKIFRSARIAPDEPWEKEAEMLGKLIRTAKEKYSGS